MTLELNMEKQPTKSQLYNAKFKQEIAQRRNRRVTCHCGQEIAQRQVIDHLKSKNHARGIAELTDLLAEKTNQDIANKILAFIVQPKNL